MAQLEMNNGINTLITDLSKAAEDVPQLRKDILTEQADVVEPALRSAISSSGLVRTGQLRDSIGRSSRNGGSVICIGPSGVRRRASRSGRIQDLRNGHLGYIYEYGLPGRGIRARNWMSNTVRKIRGKTLQIADAVYGRYLKKHNL